MKRIDEMMEPPIVGQYYMVPTVEYRYFGRLDDWPVIGPKHEDAEILKFPWHHYHIDGRFLNARRVAFVLNQQLGSIEDIIGRRPLNYMTYGVDPHPYPDPIYKRLRCRTAAFDYPHGNQPAIKRMREMFASKSLTGPCKRICPHRGAHLGSVSPNEHGIITCPLHGLRWNAATGNAAP